jgi:hypothetical protein
MNTSDDGKEWLLRGCTEREHITGWLVGYSDCDLKAVGMIV